MTRFMDGTPVPETWPGCANCGSKDQIVAWYPQYESQTIEIQGRDTDGRIGYDYNGCTDSADDAGDDDGYSCRDCGNYSRTLEGLLGVPEVFADLADVLGNIDRRRDAA